MAKKVIKAIFENASELSVEQITESGILKEVLRDEIPEAIEYAMKSKKQFARIFEINSSNSFIEINKKDWVKALEACIMWYLELEQYEKCTQLKQLIESVETNQTKKIKVKSENHE